LQSYKSLVDTMAQFR